MVDNSDLGPPGSLEDNKIIELLDGSAFDFLDSDSSDPEADGVTAYPAPGGAPDLSQSFQNVMMDQLLSGDLDVDLLKSSLQKMIDEQYGGSFDNFRAAMQGVLDTMSAEDSPEPMQQVASSFNAALNHADTTDATIFVQQLIAQQQDLAAINTQQAAEITITPPEVSADADQGGLLQGNIVNLIAMFLGAFSEDLAVRFMAFAEDNEILQEMLNPEQDTQTAAPVDVADVPPQADGVVEGDLIEDIVETEVEPATVPDVVDIALEEPVDPHAAHRHDGDVISDQGVDVSRLAEGAVSASQMVNVARPVLDLIRLEESSITGGSYDTVFGGAKEGLCEMTVQEVLDWQLTFKGDDGTSTACGAYNIIHDTLNGLVQNMNLSGDEIFDQDLQDRMAVELLKGRCLVAFVEGDMSKEEFMGQLSTEWAAFPKDMTGAGVHDGVNVNGIENRAYTSPDRVMLALNEVRSNHATAVASSYPDAASGFDEEPVLTASTDNPVELPNTFSEAAQQAPNTDTNDPGLKPSVPGHLA